MSFEPGPGDAHSGRSFGDGAPPVSGGTKPVTGTALVRLAPGQQPWSFPFKTSYVIWGAGFLLALGMGAVGLQSVRTGTAASLSAERIQADASTQVLRRLENEVSRLKGSVDTLRTTAEGTRQDDSLRGLRKSVDNLKQEIEQVKASDGATLAQLSNKLDRTERDPSQKLAEIMARLEKLDQAPKAGEPAAQKLSEVQNRLERIERQVASPMATGSIPVPPAAPRASTPAAVPVPVPSPAAAAPAAPYKGAAKQEMSVVAQADPKASPIKAATVDGWVLRDVYDGLALVEARGGTLREVAPGEYLPGVGEIRSIERRGKSWIVLTSRGVIENNTW